MQVEKLFAQYKPLQMETDALKASLGKLADEVKREGADKDLYITYLTLKADILSRVKRIMEIKKEIEEVIAKIDNPTLRTLLQYRYIGGETFEKTAELMCYEERHIYRLHKKAIEAAKNLCDK